MSDTPRPRERIVLSAREKQGLLDYWPVQEKHRSAASHVVKQAAMKIPSFARIIASMTAEQEAAQDAAGREVQRAAIFDGKWEEWFDSIRVQGAMYARMDIPFRDWFEIVSAANDVMMTAVVEEYASDLKKASSALCGMARIVDVALGIIGEAYLATKEEVINQQLVAIRELSTPVLQVQDGILIVPLIGVIDTHRARQLTEDLLRDVRARRARVVVVDITGVGVVDSKVANHIVQTIASAELMGVSAILTGISPGIAQTLVTIGAELRGVRTLGDLQSGVAEAHRMLGYRLSKRVDDKHHAA